MNQHVGRERGGTLERLGTHATLERLLARVHDHVLLQADVVVEHFIAHFTAHQLLPVSRWLPRRRAAGHFRTAARVDVLDWARVVRTGRGYW